MDVLSPFYPNLSTSSKLPQKVFGCVLFVHVNGQDRGKIDPRALKCEVLLCLKEHQAGALKHIPFISFDYLTIRVY